MNFAHCSRHRAEREIGRIHIQLIIRHLAFTQYILHSQLGNERRLTSSHSLIIQLGQLVHRSLQQIPWTSTNRLFCLGIKKAHEKERDVPEQADTSMAPIGGPKEDEA